MYTLGIDIGTTKIAGVLLQSGASSPECPERIVHSIRRDNDAAVPSVHNWEKQQDPERICLLAISIVKELQNMAETALCAIGISSQMHGFLYVNEQGQAISSLFTWQDQRAALPLDMSKTGFSGSAQELIQQKTGQRVFAGYALASHYYNCIQGLQPTSAYRLVSIGTYLGMRLCQSSVACIDPSEAAAFGLYNLQQMDFYCQDIQQLWGEWGHTDFLPERVPFYSSVGKTAEGIPVFQSLGDNQASFYGACQAQGYKLLLNLGTGGQVSLLLDSQATTALPPSLIGLEVRPYPHGLLLVGSTLAGGKSFEYLVDFFGEVLTFFGRSLPRTELYARIDAQIFAPPENPLCVEPYFGGTRTQPEIRGSIGNIDMSNLRPYHLLYGFAQAIVQELKDLLRENQLGDRIGSQIVGAGNGIRRNPMVCKMIEQVFGCQLIVPDFAEEAACGAARYARKGLELTASD